MKKVKLTDLLIFIVIAELAGAVSALLAGNQRIFYEGINRPPFSPPAWVFPVVWTILYALMGISAYMVWNTHKNELKRSFALKTYYIQLAVNFLWSIIFFRFQLLGAAAAAAVVLLMLVAVMIITFYRVRPLAARLNIPYLLWMCFAAYLAVAVYIIN